MKHLRMASTLAVAALATAGCNKGMECAEGAYKGTDPTYCIKLPDGYKPDAKPMKSGETTYVSIRNQKSLNSFSIWFEKKDDLDKKSKILANMASSDLKLVSSGDVPGRTGKFFHFHNPSKNYDFAVVLIQGKDNLYRCEIQNTPSAEATVMVDACKSFSAP